MNIKKKFLTFVISFAMVLSLVPTINVQAATQHDIKIISDSEVTAKEAEKWAESKGATETFIDLAELYWKYASECGDVNPAIAYVQAAKETAYGKFGGVIDKSYHNPCGLKTAEGGDNYDPNAHEKFDSWDEGVQAHLDHLALYAGASGYPRSNSYDPRNFVTIKGEATTINSLSGTWAPSATYGEEVNALYKDLLVYAGVEKADEDKETDYNKGNSNNESSTPNPGIPENKPSMPNVKDISNNNKPGAGDNTQGNEPNITSTVGWKNVNGVWYYYKSDNTKAKGWIKPDSNWYYLKDDGNMATGWLNDCGTWYHFNNAGIMSKGWLKDGERWYYFQSDGSMITGLNKIENKVYTFTNSGSMKTGWENINNYWYYFNTDGSMATGWITDGWSRYYLYDTGAMAKGWINITGAWYYLNDSGSMTTGWINVGNDSYYLEPSTGRMLTNTTIDGYKIGANGKKEKITSQSSTSNNNQPATSNPNTLNGKKTIVIDPGHNYGGDYGAESTIDGVTYTETELNMEVASKLETELKNRGYNVIMTREEDDRETLDEVSSLNKRIKIANNANADFFISIHHNSADATDAEGIESYYSSKAQDEEFGGKLDSNRIAKSKQMAADINNAIADKLDLKNRGAKDSALKVCMNTTMPGVLVEVGFITNKEEAERCADSKSQQKVAEAIAEVISENY